MAIVGVRRQRVKWLFL